ncbi:AAA family ATPase [Nannocystaceae bacterium ST9]
MTKLLEIRIRGLRTLADVSLQLGGLTVLIGDNGTGKSTLLEALRIVSLIPGGRLIDDLSRAHPLASAIRIDGGGLQIDVRFECEGQDYTYALDLGKDARYIESETMSDGTAILLRRMGMRVEESAFLDPRKYQTVSGTTSLLQFLSLAPDTPPPFAALVHLLEGIDSYLPFDVTAVWGKRQRNDKSNVREPQLVEPGHRLAMFGDNLVNVYQTLKNDKGTAHWQDTLHYLRLGLGADLKDVMVSAAGGGYNTLAVEFASIGKIPALHLADGVLSYLAFIAMFRLDDNRTLLAFDEPETHLHPSLLARVMTFFDDASTRYPVVLSTHSDRALDALADPVASVVVCELDSRHRTRLRRLDAEQFEKWRVDYLGVGNIRAENQLESILVEDAE